MASPRQNGMSGAVQPPLPPSTTSTSAQSQEQQEPLLSLITSTHPLLSTAINGSLSAYSSSKSYSPSFRYGAEFIERNIGTPVASTVGSVGRRTGVEGGLRWALQRRESSSDAQNGPSKRRKMDELDVEKGMREAEQLPPYDDQRSPRYEEIGTGNAVTPPSTNGNGEIMVQSDASSPEPQGRPWQRRLMISTSGLGVAMSEESLRNLTYCLQWLRGANTRLGTVIANLKALFAEWDGSGQQQRSQDMQSQSTTTTQTRSENGQADPHGHFAARVEALRTEVFALLKQCVNIVSTYAGTSLPDNARNLVRRHLNSLPRRFMIANRSTTSAAPSPSADGSANTSTEGSGSETRTNAHRAVVLAQEGLDMMVQVTQVVNDTLVSAESWCDKLGRKRQRERSSGEIQVQQNGNGNGIQRPEAVHLVSS